MDGPLTHPIIDAPIPTASKTIRNTIFRKIVFPTIVAFVTVITSPIWLVQVVRHFKTTLTLWRKASRSSVKLDSRYHDYDRLAKVLSRQPSLPLFQTSAQFQTQEGYCAPTTERMILKSIPGFNSNSLSPMKIGPSQPDKVAATIDILAKAGGITTRSHVIYGSDGYTPFLSALRIVNDPRYRVSANFLRSPLFGIDKTPKLVASLFLSGHFSPIVGFDEAEGVVAVFDVNAEVLVPIMVAMILVGVLRHYATMLLMSMPKQNLKAIREGCALTRARMLRQNQDIPVSAFVMRRGFLVDAFEKKEYLKNPEATANGGAPNPLQDPAALSNMMDGLKKNMMMVVPQTIIMSWINFFFSGFILIKLPFPLTLRFKSMLQAGIETRDMDVSWVSSISWYFLNLMGLQSIFTIILGQGNSAGGMRDMQQMQAMNPAMMAAGAGSSPDATAMFKSEKEFLEIAHHHSRLTGVEARVLELYGVKQPAEDKKKV
ncbi:ER membrane complex subunit 3 [Rhizoclosmatium hyalinum]|nr:ER membrane complex subunit 3 [Rhizoclosmatium hyalinum]